MTPNEAATQILLAVAPELAELYEEHLRFNGELLPIVFFGDVAVWLAGNARTSPDAATRIASAVEWLNLAGGPDVQDLVGAGFVEGLPSGSEDDGVLLEHLGPTTRRRFETLLNGEVD